MIVYDSCILDERIEPILDEKRGMADEIMGEAVGGFRKWIKNELNNFLAKWETTRR